MLKAAYQIFASSLEEKGHAFHHTCIFIGIHLACARAEASFHLAVEARSLAGRKLPFRALTQRKEPQYEPEGDFRVTCG